MIFCTRGTVCDINIYLKCFAFFARPQQALLHQQYSQRNVHPIPLPGHRGLLEHVLSWTHMIGRLKLSAFQNSNNLYPIPHQFTGIATNTNTTACLVRVIHFGRQYFINPFAEQRANCSNTNWQRYGQLTLGSWDAQV